MEITLITGTKKRHKYFAELLTTACNKLNVIEETPTLLKRIKYKSNYSKNIYKYFSNLNSLEEELFKKKKKHKIIHKPKIYPVSTEQLNNNKLKFLDDLKNTDLFILYGCSFIKKKLSTFLQKKNTVCIHMGVSPFYKGTDCNFWALYDNNPHLVGATILKFSKKFEEGDVIYHAIPCESKNPQKYSILVSMAAFVSLIKKIKNKSLFKIKPEKQDKKKIIRNSTKKQFTEKVVKKYFSSNIVTNTKKIGLTMLKSPFFCFKI